MLTIRLTTVNSENSQKPELGRAFEDMKGNQTGTAKLSQDRARRQRCVSEQQTRPFQVEFAPMPQDQTTIQLGTQRLIVEDSHLLLSNRPHTKPLQAQVTQRGPTSLQAETTKQNHTTRLFTNQNSRLFSNSLLN